MCCNRGCTKGASRGVSVTARACRLTRRDALRAALVRAWLVASDVCQQLGQELAKLLDVAVVEPGPKPLVEAGGGATQPMKGGVASLGQIHPLDAPVFGVAGAR